MSLNDPILRATGLSKHFGSGATRVRAVDDVSFAIQAGTTFGIIGESGSGKSTLARLILRLQEPSAGKIELLGQDITRSRGRALNEVRCDMQAVFQDPYASLNPRMTAGDIVAEPLVIHRRHSGPLDLASRVDVLFEQVGLNADMKDRYPHQFSGGQRQRIGIARALALGPKLIIADEPLTALDVSVQAQIINLLMDLQSEKGLSFLLISHDLGVVRHLCEDVAVMFDGRIVECGPAHEVFNNAQHPYTQALLDAVPIPDPDARTMAPAVWTPPSNSCSTQRFITPEHWVLT